MLGLSNWRGQSYTDWDGNETGWNDPNTGCDCLANSWEGHETDWTGSEHDWDALKLTGSVGSETG